ncbi:MscS Mechanosensitive ion channel [Candidatus Sulfopaludibacter sp. SbA3]|nr:MscS Mechanosensitive ion channel [Candidatus Sulfopaludibacter sp. SbA3]
MKRSKNLPAIAVVILLAACLLALFETRDNGSPVTAKKPVATAQAPAVDDRLLRTARQMAATADTPDEQDDAREALHLADHALDQAFATALRAAETPAAPASNDLRELAAQIDKLKADIAAGQTRIDQLTKAAATSDAAADELELANAEIALEKDELDDAEQDRAREGGDRHSAIERALQQHESDQKQAPPLPKLTDPSAAATLAQQIQLWFALAGRAGLLQEARQQALDLAASLTAQHNALESQSAAATNAAAPGGETTGAKVARLRRLSDQRKTLTEFDKRVQDCQQLASVYQNWSAVVAGRQRSELHRVLGGLSVILAILLVVVVIDRVIRHAFHQADRKRLHQIRMLATLGVQLLAVVAILLIVFGPPTQLSTIIGLATAGLTVVMKDFIVAFFGWFTLMGKNGIRVGDWVEIEGVSGEVIEIGILKTVLLEMGTSAGGRPTGRQVAFSNSFAMEKHYFNFSTSSQWVWDQLEVTIPPGGDPYRIVQQIRETVERETESDAAGAAEEWQRVASTYGASTFSAKPAVDLRPSPLGLEVVVSYITKAPNRDTLKTHLFHVIVDLLHKRASA